MSRRTTGNGAGPGRRKATFRGVALAVALSLFAAGTINAASAPPAFAADYPSWSDVVNARSSEAATVAELRRIEGLLLALQSEVERTQAEAEAKGNLYYEADLKYQEAALVAAELQGQAEAARLLAEQSKARAGELIAQQYREGVGDVSTKLFINAGQADDLLYSFGMADKFTEQTAGVYAKAVQDQNTAQALTDQAVIAQQLLDELRIEAEAAFIAAQEAATAAAAALEEQRVNRAQLEAQAAVLAERRAVTEADYAKGVAVAIAAAAAAAAGAVNSAGWAKPVSGWISSSFGWRVHPISGNRALHAGTDIAAGCGTPIYAASAGTVEYAGWNGGYGYYVRINHGGGYSTAYGHIIAGGILVGNGQQVGAGQNIARVGTTGSSNGCHLHFEVRNGGNAQDPAPFMRDRGVVLG